ncbi:MAG: hypothetical protein ACE5L7_04490 [Candidatus Aminicenantales bacterium]
MRKPLFLLILSVLFLVFSGGMSSSQEVDLSGTWVGKTEVPDQGPDEITLTLQKNNGEYSGTISDSLGMLQDEECGEIEFKEGTLSFHIYLFMGEEYITVYFTLTVKGDKMSGYWQTEDGSSGSVELERA